MNKLILDKERGHDHEFVSPVTEVDAAERECGPLFAAEPKGSEEDQFLHSEAD